MSSERLLPVILSSPDEPLHLPGPPLLQVMTSWATIWAAALSLLQPRRGAPEAGGAAIYGRLPHCAGDLQVHVGVESVGDELRAGDERGEYLGGGDLHLGVDLLRTGEQGATEDARVAEDVVHAAAVGGEGSARLEGVPGFNLRVGIRERQDHLPL